MKVLAKGANIVRQSFRRYVRLDCEVVRTHDFHPIGSLALDLSTTGMMLRTNERVLTGEELVFAFRPPSTNKFVDGIATVARVIHNRRPGDQGRALGLEFHSMSSKDVSLLWESLRGLPPPVPSRQVRVLTVR